MIRNSSWKTKIKHNSFSYKISYNYNFLTWFSDDKCTENGYYFFKEQYEHIGSSQYFF